MIMDDTKCSCCGSEKELYRTNDGKYCWLFSWEGSGGNDVWATTREDAIAQIAKEFSTLQPVLSSLRRCTYEEWRSHDRALQMMCI